MARCASKRQTKDTERIQDWRFLPGRRGTRWLGPRKRDKQRAKLTNILLSADIRGVVSALVVEGPLPKRADYHVAIQYCMEGLVHQAFRYPVGERVTFVIDQKDKVKNEVEATRIWLQKDGHRSMGRRIGGAVFDDSRIILPLQAADLLAYEPLQEVKSWDTRARFPFRSDRHYEDLRAKVYGFLVHQWNGRRFLRYHFKTRRWFPTGSRPTKVYQ